MKIKDLYPSHSVCCPVCSYDGLWTREKEIEFNKMCMGLKHDDNEDNRYHDGFLDGMTKVRGELGLEIDKLESKLRIAIDVLEISNHALNKLKKGG